MVSGRTKAMTLRVKGSARLLAAQRDDENGDPSEEYLLLRADENGSLRLTEETDEITVTARTKGVTFRVTGDVILGAAQRDDPDGVPTEEYLLLRADENSQLRTTT